MATDIEALPHDLAAERAVLGAVLVRAGTVADVRDIVTPEHFYRQAHGTLFRRMLALADAGTAIDILTLVPVLERHGELDAVGGVSYIARLIDGIPRTANAPHYADEVRACFQRREAVRIALELGSAARSDDDIDDVCSTAEQALRATQTGQRDALITAAQAVAGAMETLEAYETAETVGITGVATGIYGLDHLLGGWQPDDLIVIAARPSVGKTAFAGQVCAYAAIKLRVPVVFVTLEQPAKRLAARMASNMAKVDLEAYRERQVGEDELARMGHALSEVHAAPLSFVDGRGKRMSDIRRVARMAHARGQCGLLAIDYLGLVAAEASKSKGETRERQVAIQSGMAKDIARELHIPVLLLCQLNREYEKDQPKPGAKRAAPRRPRLADLRESGAVEQDADVVLFVHRPFVRPANPEEAMREGQTELIVAKHRNGAIGDVSAHYTKEWVRFTEAGA